MDAIALVVGNGLTIDFCRYRQIGLDPSNPFEWAFEVPMAGSIPWTEAFPNLTRVLRSGGKVRSFDAFEDVLRHVRSRDHRASIKLDAEARQFLVFAYSYLQEAIGTTSLLGWSWAEWLIKQVAPLCAVVSFNYDLLIEATLSASGMTPCRPGLSAEQDGVFVHKPHGSVDFAQMPGLIEIGPITYPLQNWVTLNNTPLVALPADKLRQARREAYVVLPAEYSPYLNYQWVGPGYAVWRQNAPRLTHCIFVGLSDWKCDRPEMDYLLDSLGSDTTVIIANPHPPESFEKRVIASGRPLLKWTQGPEILPLTV